MIPIPSSRGTRGVQSSSAEAREISGFRRNGSSSPCSRWTVPDPAPQIRSMVSASAAIVVSSGLPRFTGPGGGTVQIHIRQQSVHQIVNETERPGLETVAHERQRVAEQRLDNEVRDHAPVRSVHARAVGVEDPRHPYVDAVLPAVVEKQGLRASLAFVVASARADRINVAPILFLLRMGQRVTVDLAGRRLKDAGAAPLGEVEHVDRAVNGGLHGLHRIVLVMNRAGRTGQIENPVDLEPQRLGDVVPNELEIRLAEQAGDIGLAAREKIVEADHVVTLRHQTVA